jgi:hypothetical protein
MINWPKQPLYFAVLDGAEPHKWVPWKGGSSLGDIYDDYRQQRAKRTPCDDAPDSSLELLTAPFDDVLASRNQSNIVGVIVDAKEDPGDIVFYERKMDQLEKLCRSIWANSKGEDLLIKKTLKGFSVWFFIGDHEMDSWNRWVLRAHDIVMRNLGKPVDPDWVPTGALFKFAADRFLNDIHYKLLTGGR